MYASVVMDVGYAWEYDDTDHPRPPEIARLEALCNTIDRHTYGAHAHKADEDRDLLSTPARLADWLTGVGLSVPSRRDHAEAPAVGPEHLDDVRALREGVRAWLQARQGLPYERSAVRKAQQVLDRAHLRVDLDTREGPAGSCTLTPAGSGVASALSALAVDLATAAATGTLKRLKICNAPDCGFVFYDHSRSRTSRWCSMDTCGNRIKTRRYRQRHR